MKRFLKIVLIISICIWLFTCARTSDHTSHILLKIVPNFTPKGWKLYGDVKQFTPENLYEHINGRAEFYIAYDVDGLIFANFTKNDLMGPFIDLFIYDMKNPTNAFGVFSSERSKTGTPVKLGRGAYIQESNYYIWKGRYYIMIIASENSEELKSIGMKLAQKTSHSLSDSGQEVWGLSALPQKDLLPESITYFKKDAMGLDFMANTYTANYRKYNTDIKHFISRKESKKSAADFIEKYSDFARQYGKGAESRSIDNINLIICDMEDYSDVIFQKGSLVAGTLSVESKEPAVKAAIEMYNQLP